MVDSPVPHIKRNVMGQKTILVYFIKYKEQDVERERERERESERERERERERRLYNWSVLMGIA